jgi:hypothetical protein
MASYTTFEGTHKTDDGVELYTKTWKVSGDAAKARMLFVHGFSDHCNNYPVFFDHLANHGVDIYAFDQRYVLPLYLYFPPTSLLTYTEDGVAPSTANMSAVSQVPPLASSPI